jgi:hypothetical protein
MQMVLRKVTGTLPGVDGVDFINNEFIFPVKEVK